MAQLNAEMLLTLPADYQSKYNQLEDIKEMKDKAKNLGGFESVRAIILENLNEQEKEIAKKYSVYITINHRHFTLPEGMVLIENCKPLQYLDAYPQSFSTLNENTVPHRWHIDASGNILPVEWSRDSGVKENVSQPEFLQLVTVMLNIIKNHGMQDCFGISTVRRDSLPAKSGFSYLEQTSVKSSRIVLKPNQEIDERAFNTGEPLFINKNAEEHAPCLRCVGGDDGYCTFSEWHEE